MAGRIAVAVFCIEQVAWQVLARRLNDGLLARASVKVGVGGTAPLGRRSVDGVGGAMKFSELLELLAEGKVDYVLVG